MGRDVHETRKRKGESRGVRRNSKGTADWAGVDAALLRDTIVSASLRGGALRLGYTSDGGAYSIGIYGDGDPYTEYVRPAEDIEQFLRDVIELFDSL